MKVKYIRKHNNKMEKHSNPVLNETGFENPFDDSTGGLSLIDDADDPLFNALGTHKGVDISNISVWNTNVGNKIVCRNNHVYANKFFCKGDIIEESPIKPMSSKDLYSKNIRDCVFPLDPEKDLYGLPLGYAVCYRNSKDTPSEPNVKYYYDEDNNTLVFTATKPIKRGMELIIDASDDDFANELNASQFNYEPGLEPIYTTKNYKIV